jgi:hypothetical protein
VRRMRLAPPVRAGHFPRRRRGGSQTDSRVLSSHDPKAARLIPLASARSPRSGLRSRLAVAGLPITPVPRSAPWAVATFVSRDSSAVRCDRQARFLQQPPPPEPPGKRGVATAADQIHSGKQVDATNRRRGGRLHSAPLAVEPNLRLVLLGGRDCG